MSQASRRAVARWVVPFSFLAATVTALAWPQQAFADDPFIPSIYNEPWLKYENQPLSGFGQRVGTAALLGDNRLLVVGRETAVQVFVTPRTRVIREGTRVDSSELTQGMWVRATFNIRGNTLVASQVVIYECEPPQPPAVSGPSVFTNPSPP
jgi:hypothetical protein